jgi:radical SAM superfamily enzyme YgiQ (UPF0313 family)
MKQENILLLNPPADTVCIRDYFCSKTSRSDYLFPPIDLLMLSGRLSRDYKVTVIDAIAEKLNFSAAIEKIKMMNFKAVVSLVGAVAYASDLEFLQAVKQTCNIPIICIGDAVLERPKDMLNEYVFLDAIILDFTNEDLLYYLTGNFEQIKNMAIKTADGIIEKRANREKETTFDLPVPRHELFLNKNYRLPLSKGKPFTVVLTDFGCPFACSFCVMPTLGYKYRGIDNVVEELIRIHALGIEEIFFLDQTFGAIKERGVNLCAQMIERKFNFGWTCFTRADLQDEDSLKLMKEAGCHTVIAGVESGEDEILKMYRKGCDLNKIRAFFHLCRKLKIRTIGTFIIGFPEDTRESCLKTIRFAKQLNCDFASFHVAVPRPETPLRKKALQMGLTASNLSPMDQSGSFIAMASQKLTKEEILKLRAKAVRDFYLRPQYLLNRIISCGSAKEIIEQIREGWFLIKSNL